MSDSKNLESLYSDLLLEGTRDLKYRRFAADEGDYPQWALDMATRTGQHPEQIMNHADGEEPESEVRKFKPRAVGDVFTGKKDGKKWEVYKRADGTLGVKPHGGPKVGDVFTGRDGKKWERVLRKDGTMGVKPAP